MQQGLARRKGRRGSIPAVRAAHRAGFRSCRASRRPGAIGACALVVLAVGLFLPGTATAGHGPVAPGGPYSGFSHGTTLHVDALTVGTTRLANVDVGLASSAASSTGLKAQLNAYKRPVNPDAADKHGYARSSIADVGIAANPSADAQLKPFDAVALAPPPARVDKTAVDQTVGPVLDVSLARNVADATWTDGTCVLGRPISTAEEHLARVDVLETADNPATAPEQGFDAPIAAIDSNQLGPPRAATHTLTREELYYPGSGSTFGLRSFAHSTLAPVTLFQGTANELTIEVDGPAFLDVRASGQPGGASVELKAPIVTISRGTSILAQIPPLPAPLPQIPAVTIPAASSGDVLAEVKVAALDPIPAERGGLGTTTKSDDGTKAAAQASIVQVRILDLPSQNITGATVSLGHMEAAAVVPSGGITCPIPVTKTIDRASVVAGQTFTTTITVFNRFDCPLNDVKLTDLIEIEDAARFKHVSADPSASKTPPGENLKTGTVEWSLGTMAPHSEKSVTLVLQAQGGAGIIKDTATATGVLACPVSPAAGSVTSAVANVAVAGVARAQIPEAAVLPQQLPRTGATNAVGIGLGLVAVAAVVRRLALPWSG